MNLKIISVAIIEDSKQDLTLLKKAWENFCASMNFEVSIDSYINAEDFLSSYHYQYDLIFMDIDLPSKSGIDASFELRKIDNEVTLVIVSNTGQYAIDGYAVNAADFILKPVSSEILKEKMKRILNIIQYTKNKNTNIVLKNNTIIKSKDIIYVEVISHNIVYHTKNNVVTCRGTLKEVNDKLSNCCFFRINYSFLLNLDFVLSVDNFDCHLTNGETLYISRNRKKEFNYTFSRFLGGTL